MNVAEVRRILLASFPGAVVNVIGKDANYSVEIVSPVFENVSKVNRQKNVLSCVKQHITSGEIHAFSVKAFTQDEWQQEPNSLTIL